MPSRLLILAVLGIVAMFTVAACSEETAAQPVQKVAASDAVEMLDDRVVIDVRTPAEYAAGHVAGALNIDVEGQDFAASIEELDKDASYLVYCRSGRRSAIAAEQMADAGFTDIADAGGLAELAEAGAPLEA